MICKMMICGLVYQDRIKGYMWGILFVLYVFLCFMFRKYCLFVLSSDNVFFKYKYIFLRVVFFFLIQCYYSVYRICLFWQFFDLCNKLRNVFLVISDLICNKCKEQCEYWELLFVDR